MKIATWNVNSVRARLPRLLAWLESRRPDALLLQELKCQTEEFPTDEVREVGYESAVHGQKTYNGVAILVRKDRAPDGIDQVRIGLPDDDGDAGARVISAVVAGLRLVNVYVVNGQRVGAPAYDHKLLWLERLRRHIESFDRTAPLLLAGDFNITFDDRDLYDPVLLRDRILSSPPERAALSALIDLGLTDSFRQFHEEAGLYSWWDYRTRGFQRGLGLRIDHILLSDSAMSECTSVDIDKEERAGAKPSDHAPVIATFRDNRPW